jgi:hypothetical protein
MNWLMQKERSSVGHAQVGSRVSRTEGKIVLMVSGSVAFSRTFTVERHGEFVETLIPSESVNIYVQ